MDRPNSSDALSSVRPRSRTPTPLAGLAAAAIHTLAHEGTRYPPKSAAQVQGIQSRAAEVQGELGPQEVVEVGWIPAAYFRDVQLTRPNPMEPPRRPPYSLRPDSDMIEGLGRFGSEDVQPGPSVPPAVPGPPGPPNIWMAAGKMPPHPKVLAPWGHNVPAPSVPSPADAARSQANAAKAWSKAPPPMNPSLALALAGVPPAGVARGSGQEVDLMSLYPSAPGSQLLRVSPPLKVAPALVASRD